MTAPLPAARPTADRIRAARVPLCVAVLAIAALVLLGWGVGSARLESVASGMATMKVNTAAGLALLAVAVLGLDRPGVRWRWVAGACLVGAAAIALASLSEYVTGVDLHVDQLVARDPASPRFPGRPSPGTAATLLGVAAAAWALHANRFVGWAQAVLILVSAVPLTALGGYLYWAPGLYAAAAYPVIALHTSAGLMLLCVAGPCARPDRGLMAVVTEPTLAGAAARRLLPAAVVVPVVVGVAVVGGERAGLYSSAFASALVVGCCGTFFAVVTAWALRSLSRAERRGRAAEADLRASEARSRFLADLAEATRRVGDPDAVLAATVERLRAQLNVPRCAYAEVDADQDGIQVRYDAAAAGTPSVAGRFRLADFGPPLLAALRAGRTAAVTDVRADPLTDGGGPAMAAVGVAAVVNVPVVKDGRLVAVLAAHESRRRAWTADEVRLVEAVAERSWAEVERARAVRSLRASEARSAYLVELGDALRPLSDPAAVQAVAAAVMGRHLGVNRVAYFEIDGGDYVIDHDYVDGTASFVGRHPTASFGPAILDPLLAGRTVAEADTADTAGRSPPEVAVFAAAGVGAIATVPLVKDGAFVAALTAQTVGPHAWTTDELDVIAQTAERTWAAVERARAGSAVRASEARLSTALAVSDLGTFDWDLRADAIAVDVRGRAIFGFDPAAPLSSADFFARMDKADLPRVRAVVDAAIGGRRSAAVDYVIRRPDGTVCWIDSRGRFTLGADGRPERMFGVIADLTDRRRAERAVAKSEARLRALVTTSNDVVYRVNADWSQLVQLKGGSFIADTVEPDPAWLEAYIYADDQPTVRAAIAAAIAGKRTFDLEHRVNRVDGSVGWAASRAVPILDAAGAITEWFGAASDITDRRRAEAELAFERHQLELIFRESPAAMALWRGEDMVFERVNPQYQDLFRGRPLEGLPFLDAVPELRGQGFEALYRRVLHTGEPYVGREQLARIQRQAGGPVEDRYFDFTYLQVRDPDGRPWGVYDHAVDVTDRVLARRAVEQSEAAVRAALAEAELAGRMKDEFLATLSHELRTPLNAIVGWTQILKASTDPEDVAEGLDVIDRNARAQTQIIGDILDMSRIISGKLRLDVRPVDLATLVRAGVDTVRPAADAKGVQLAAVLDPAAGPVAGDPNRLHQVFWNLLSNAVKFTPQGGRVHVVLGRVDGHLEVSVTDTGEGISAEFLPHVFDRFRQQDSSTTRRHGGLGLGLSIVKQLVDLHGGSVRVASGGKGRGSTFVVDLPVPTAHPPAVADDAPVVRRQPPSTPPAAAAAAGVPRTVRPDLAGVTVVAVDDEPDGVAMVRRLLADCGAIVRTASSAAEALALVRADPPAVLVSDIGMPGQDGYALIRQVRGLPAGQGGRVPAVAMTAYARPADRMAALDAGFQMHLSKPVEPAELIAAVAALTRLATA